MGSCLLYSSWDLVFSIVHEILSKFNCLKSCLELIECMSIHIFLSISTNVKINVLSRRVKHRNYGNTVGSRGRDILGYEITGTELTA